MATPSKKAAAKPSKGPSKGAPKETKPKRKFVPNPKGRTPRYGATMKRVAFKATRALEATLREAAEREGVSVSAYFRRAILSATVRTLGPDVVGRFAVDLAERGDWIALAEQDPDAVARRVFRD